MSMVATDIKGLLSIKIKPRDDSYSDQYHRVFMVKLFLACAFVSGISWFKDSINCIVPAHHKFSGDFVSAACWIQGVYVYKELKKAVNLVAYFGVTHDMDYDGILRGSTPDQPILCRTKGKLSNIVNPLCSPMHKTYFLQYQYLPFLLGAMTVLYYLPYLAFKACNNDLVSLKNTVKEDKTSAQQVAKHYFNNKANPRKKMLARIVFNILVKLLYLAANLVVFLGFDKMLNGEFVSYGKEWGDWARTNNTMAYDYLGKRDFPKPGNLLLPPFGYCELYESAKDIKTSQVNQHKFVCELSQNILYQYCLMVIWFGVVIGIVISIIGLLLLLVHYIFRIFGIRKKSPTYQHLFEHLAFRELEYLEYMHKKNPILYGEVLEQLRDTILGPDAPYEDRAPLYTKDTPKDEIKTREAEF